MLKSNVLRISLFVLLLIMLLAGSAPADTLVGDLNLSGKVDIEDLAILAGQWLDDPGCSGHPDDCADLTGGGGVNIADFGVLSKNWLKEVESPIVINEIHYEPDEKLDRAEFVELYNAGSKQVNMSGWYFSAGIVYVFPTPTLLNAGEYLVLAQDAAGFLAKYGAAADGVYEDRLGNDGETIRLRNASGETVDKVDYKLGFPWPNSSGGQRPSMELIHPDMDNDLGGSWRPSGYDSDDPIPGNLITAKSTLWHYRKGQSEPPTNWREQSFTEDGTWQVGQTSIGYDDDGIYDINTELSDMRRSYTTVYLRHGFEFVTPAGYELYTLTVRAHIDDGCIVTLNGQELTRFHVSPGDKTYQDKADKHEASEWEQYDETNSSKFPVAGTNMLAIHVLNNDKRNKKLTIDIELIANFVEIGSGPTPGAQNTVWADNAPPQIRQVDHDPKQPAAGQVVKISAKVTDPDGVASVTLNYQLVNPGNYISITDGAYTASWTAVAMNDNGDYGDEIAGDDVYSVEMADTLQTNRRLIRYRITAEDTGTRSVQVPYADDPQPNFAYFVYDGVPAWSGAIQPGVTPVVEYGTDVMRSLPVYHLISKNSDVETSTWLEMFKGQNYQWEGTLVYDDKVYDHIRYRTRGGMWRYAMGKNMWKFDFSRGHYFQGRDDYGRKYKVKWDKLNFSACIQQGWTGQRGEQGMFEALTFKLFSLVDVPASNTNWVQFRIIDEQYEDGALNAAHSPLTNNGTQNDGDFWGLYMTIEQMDGRFLDEHDLPDGNLYKMEAKYGELKNQGLTAVTDSSDIIAFKDDMYEKEDFHPTASWWGSNVNLESYYSYRAIYHATHHSDITSKNHFFYLNPELTTNEWGENNLWWQLPWDVDLTWTSYFKPLNEVTDPFSRSDLLIHEDFDIAGKNRVREVCDLLFNPEQMNQLIDEFAAIIDDPIGGLSIVDADRAMWDYHWVMGDDAYPTYLSHDKDPSPAGQGRFYEEAEERGHSRDFAGMVQVMKGYVADERVIYMNSLCSDSAIPYTPTVSYTGTSAFAINDLTFQSSPFSDPNGGGASQFQALKWRIGEVTDLANPIYSPADPKKYEITAVWESDEITGYSENTVNIPASALKVGHTYRVRCRMQDITNRWSHWSNDIQFVAGEAIANPILQNLRVTEVMYNPTDGSNYEFIELKNTGGSTLDLTEVSFTEGITFGFAGSNVESLASGAYVLVVNDQAAFESRYGTGLSGMIAGEFVATSLNNGGEDVELVDYVQGDIVVFEYNDARGWPLAADGAGHSLVPLNSTVIANEPAGSLDYGDNWRQSTYIGGSPGADDPEQITDVVINEFMAHTDYPVSPHESNDWIELYNTTGATVNLNSNWYLSDDIDDLKKYALPSSSLGGNSWTSFDQVTHFNTDGTGPLGFGLNKAGEQVILSYLPSTSADRVVDCVKFKGQKNGISLGRYPDGGIYWLHSAISRDSDNDTPISHVVIDEIMYNPVAPDEEYGEYIELYNPTGGSVNLYNPTGVWRLDGGGKFDFPPGTSIGAGSRLIVVGFDPVTETATLNAFEAAYGTGNLTPGTDIVGGWSKKLSDGGDKVALEKPEAGDLPGDPDFWVIVDEVIYTDVSPWPTTPDGLGDALQRQSFVAGISGNDADNWQSESPSPGQ